MTRHECVQSIAYHMWDCMKKEGLEQYTNPVSDWECAEDVFEFWDSASRDELPEQWISAEEYEDKKSYKRFYDEYRKTHKQGA